MQTYQPLASILEIENSFECIEFLPQPQPKYVGMSDLSLTPSALDLLNRYCPALPKLVIDLGAYEHDWQDTFSHGSTCLRSFFVRGQERRDMILALGSFAGLRQIVIHFYIRKCQLALSEPEVGIRAAREIHKRISDSRYELRRNTRRFDLDVIFHTSSGYIFGYNCDITDLTVKMSIKWDKVSLSVSVR